MIFNCPRILNPKPWDWEGLLQDRGIDVAKLDEWEQHIQEQAS